MELPDLASPTPCTCSPDESCGIVIGVTGQLSVPVAASALDILNILNFLRKSTTNCRDI